MNENESFSDRLKRWRVTKMDWTQPQAAKCIGIGRSYYSELENGREPGEYLRLRFEALESKSVDYINNLIAEKDGRVREEAEENDGAPSRPSIIEESRIMRVRKVPLIGWAQAGAAVDFEDVTDWDNVISVETNDPRAIAVRVRGDSMVPEINEGDIIVLSRSDRPEDENLICARLRDEGVVLKRLKVVDPQKRLFRLISANPAYAPFDRTEDQFLWIHKVVWVMQKKG